MRLNSYVSFITVENRFVSMCSILYGVNLIIANLVQPVLKQNVLHLKHTKFRSGGRERKKIESIGVCKN